MKILSEGELLPKIIEAYSRPTRIVRGKDGTHDLEVRNSEIMCYALAFLKMITLLIHPFYCHSNFNGLQASHCGDLSRKFQVPT